MTKKTWGKVHPPIKSGSLPRPPRPAPPPRLTRAQRLALLQQ
jgi:hypothetical protein